MSKATGPSKCDSSILFELRKGRVFEQNTKPIPEDIPIKPKATYTFVIDENQRNGFENWRAQNNGRDAVKLQVSMNHLSYGDGTGFTSLGALPFPFKNNPDELGRCLRKPLPPDEWAKTPTVFSGLLAQSLEKPASLMPVIFFLRTTPIAVTVWALRPYQTFVVLGHHVIGSN